MSRWKKVEEWLKRGRYRVLALSGGGARGLAHIGVLQEMDRLGAKPELITGTSMGAIVGALYCLHGNAERLEESTRSILESDEFRSFNLDDLVEQDKQKQNDFEQFGRNLVRLHRFARMFREISMVSGKKLQTLMEQLFGNATFEDLKIPFIAVATDLVSGEDVHITEGYLYRAAMASSALPAVFPPVEFGDTLLIDGGVTKNVPIPDPDETPHPPKVIAVDVMRSLYHEGPYETALDVLSRSDWITMLHLNEFYLREADLVIVPRIRKIHWAEFTRLDDLVQAGRRAVQDEKERILELFGQGR